eukprot:12164254-Heterocapsa_arctica.AAC.1
MNIWEPERVSGLPGLDAPDAKWIGELHSHQVRCGLHSALPAVVYKISIDALTDSLYPSLAEASQPVPMTAEKER